MLDGRVRVQMQTRGWAGHQSADLAHGVGALFKARLHSGVLAAAGGWPSAKSLDCRKLNGDWALLDRHSLILVRKRR